ncbi:MAG TPA: hypothetical protein VMU42_06655 [Candidatus Sulfotelmatobacter sp.]|nr:hypothetical protein [Candidatus Sulfotelmatobacter sp.]
MMSLARMTVTVLLGMAVAAGTIAGAIGQPVAQEALQALGSSVLVRDPSGTEILSVFSLVVLVAAASAPLLLVGAGIVHLTVLRVMARRIEALYAVAGRLEASAMRRSFLQAFRQWSLLRTIAARYLSSLTIERDPVRDGSRLSSSRPAADFFTADAMLMDPATKALFDRLPLICVVLGVLGLLADLGNGLLRVRAALAAGGGDGLAILTDRATAGVVLLFGCLALAVLSGLLRWVLSLVGQPLAHRLQTAVDALFWRPARNPPVPPPAADGRAAEWMTDALTLIEQRFDSERRARRESLAELHQTLEAVLAASRERGDEGRLVQESLHHLAQQVGAAMTAIGRAGAVPAPPGELHAGMAAINENIARLHDGIAALARQETAAVPGEQSAAEQGLRTLQAAVDDLGHGLGALQARAAGTGEELARLHAAVGVLVQREAAAAVDHDAAGRAHTDEVSARLAMMSDAMRDSIGQLASIVDSLSRIAAALGQRPERSESAPHLPSAATDTRDARMLLSELRELISGADDVAEPSGKRGGGLGD